MILVTASTITKLETFAWSAFAVMAAAMLTGFVWQNFLGGIGHEPTILNVIFATVLFGSIAATLGGFLAQTIVRCGEKDET